MLGTEGPFPTSEDNFFLITLAKKPPKMVVELEGLARRMLDRKKYRSKGVTLNILSSTAGTRPQAASSRPT